MCVGKLNQREREVCKSEAHSTHPRAFLFQQRRCLFAPLKLASHLHRNIKAPRCFDPIHFGDFFGPRAKEEVDWGDSKEGKH
ncbi:hypothetical protein E2320_006887 [Naja naja]|nr:hypothetical protein E2320_006887 [Naja naja]